MIDEPSQFESREGLLAAKCRFTRTPLSCCSLRTSLVKYTESLLHEHSDFRESVSRETSQPVPVGSHDTLTAQSVAH